VHLGYDLDEKTFEKVFDDFIALCDKKKNVYDADIAALVENRVVEAPRPVKLVSFHTSAGTGSIPTATVQLCEEGETGRLRCGHRRRPVDAVFNALERITGIDARLQNYQVRSLTVGKRRRERCWWRSSTISTCSRKGRQHRHHRGQRPRLTCALSTRRQPTPTRAGRCMPARVTIAQAVSGYSGFRGPLSAGWSFTG